MQAQHQGMRQRLDVYPLEEKIRNLQSTQAVFIDIGGGIGHQSNALRQHLPPQVTNKIIVQDLDVIISHAIPVEDVQPMPYNFFEPRPIKGARFYYFRNIMHDYPDDKAVEILKNTISAFGSNSVILIDDMVIPVTGTHWHATQVDITMMSVLASRERTIEQWHVLLKKAGLKINQIYTYTESLRDSIIECVAAEE